MSTLAEIAQGFESITLAELDRQKLMDRVDRKYLLPINRLESLLVGCMKDYRVLEVGGVRLNRYTTRYYDTADLSLYHAHHNDRAPRAKVRVREYLDSGLRFIELKRKTNKGRTYKTRVSLKGEDADPLGLLAGLPGFEESGIRAAGDLGSVLDVDYSRLTLVSRADAERVTIDVDLVVRHNGRSVGFPEIAIAEVKQSRRVSSPFVEGLREARIHEGSISKYCLGVASLVDGARTNRFKPRLHELHRIARSNSS